jgi:hypothetical protein
MIDYGSYDWDGMTSTTAHLASTMAHLAPMG